LEAALYGRALGYDVHVYEKGQIGNSLRSFAHVRLFTPFSLNASSLGLAACWAQDPGFAPPGDGEILPAGELMERYYVPLSRTDLLDGRIHEDTEILAAGRSGAIKGDLPGVSTRRDGAFLLLLRDAGRERIEEADIVLDATGTFGNHASLGRGGLPAVGERECDWAIDYGLPDITGAEQSKYGNRHTLVIGAGYSAATNVIALATLARDYPDTRVTWVTRDASHTAPIGRIPEDRLPERDRIAVEANRLAKCGAQGVTWLPGRQVASLRRGDDGRIEVALLGQQSAQTVCDRILANVGWRPDTNIFRELQVHLCYASEGPMKLAASLLKNASADCLDEVSQGPEVLKNPEPDFYILGSKSYGRGSKFLLSVGLAQIRDVFSLIGGRGELDLYKSTPRIPG
jgi:hypothetical protein